MQKATIAELCGTLMGAMIGTAAVAYGTIMIVVRMLETVMV